MLFDLVTVTLSHFKDVNLTESGKCVLVSKVPVEKRKTKLNSIQMLNNIYGRHTYQFVLFYVRPSYLFTIVTLSLAKFRDTNYHYITT